tara:strand:- start:373 stop:1230 length:858 start_codon:yes stop_codon:yes gene_type:complete
MVKKKENIIIKPEIEDISFKSGNIKEDVVLHSPKTPTIIEQMIESELPWDVQEQTSYIIERKTDTQFLNYENDVILNTLTKPTKSTPELYTLSSGSISEIYSPLEQNIGNYYKLKQLISYDYKNPTFSEINNYPGVDLNYNGEQIVKNLKNLMENCVDRIIEAYPNFILISAYRSLTLNRMIGGSHDNSNHISGCAIDFKISEEHTSYIFNWCIKNLPEFYELMWAYPERGNKSWIHISYKKGQNIKRTTLASEREDIHKSYGGYRRGYKQEYQEGIVEAIQNLV